jgi:hypothetical protein
MQLTNGEIVSQGEVGNHPWLTARRLVAMVCATYGRLSMRLASCSIALLVLTLVCSACAASPDPWHLSRGGPYIRVLASADCPTSLGPARDVCNFGAWRLSELVPESPTGGLICRYAASATSPPSAAVHPELYRQVRLTAAQAFGLARVIGKVSTAAPKGTFSCPAGWSTATVIAFSYRGRSDADLWYYDSGCQTLDNGKIGAFQGGNQNFYLHFVPLIDRLAPQTELPPG